MSNILSQNKNTENWLQARENNAVTERNHTDLEAFGPGCEEESRVGLWIHAIEALNYCKLSMMDDSGH